MSFDETAPIPFGGRIPKLGRDAQRAVRSDWVIFVTIVAQISGKLLGHFEKHHF